MCKNEKCNRDTPEVPDDYTNSFYQQAEDFLKRHNITMTIDLVGEDEGWGGGGCYAYCITMTKPDGRSMKVGFWGSEQDHADKKKELHPYDVLACISGDHTYETEDDILYAFGDTAGIDIVGLLEEARDMRAFFTEEELEELIEIQ